MASKVEGDPEENGVPEAKSRRYFNEEGMINCEIYFWLAKGLKILDRL